MANKSAAKFKTISVSPEDYETFLKHKFRYAGKLGRSISNTAYFTILIKSEKVD